MFENILKMSSPGKKRLLVSLIAGLVPALLVWTYIRSVENDHADRMSLVPVLVASRDIPQGTRLLPGLFETRHVPKIYAQPHCVSTSELLDEKGKFLYENLLPIAAGEQLTASKLCGLGVSGGFAWLIPEGHVALSLDLSPDRAVGGLIEPGDSVDILATLETEGNHGSKNRTATLFQNVKVLGVGDRLIAGRSFKKTEDGKAKEAELLKGPEGSNPPITLALRPFEAAVVTYARETGSLRLALRPVGDTRISNVGPVDMTSLNEQTNH